MTASSTLTRDAKIADLFLLGNPIDTIAAAGRERGWNRADCLRVAAENGWGLDPTGRIPRAQRKPNLASVPRPVTDLGPGRAQIGALLGQPPAPQPDPVERLIADGKAHSVARVRKLAEKAETAIADLRAAVAAEIEREKVRARLAELDAERVQLRSQLGKPQSDRPAKPINHGSYGGWQAHSKRGEDPCDDCVRGKDEHTARMRAAKKEKSA